VEGISDYKIMRQAFTLFRPDALEVIEIESNKSAGASWVTRQLIVWAHSLHKNSDGEIIKAAGLFDGDEAGRFAVSEVNRVVKADSAEAKTFKMFNLSLSYAIHLRPIKQKGIVVPVCLEEMFGVEQWNFAKCNGWLELRNKPYSLLKTPANWNSFEISFKDYLDKLNLTDEEKLYLNIVGHNFKIDFVNHILGHSEESKKKVFSCYESLVNDLCTYLLHR
jgi:hypothetical protein